MNKVISLTYMYWSLLVLSFNNRRVLSFAYRSSSSSSLSKACYVPNHVFACCKKRRSINNLQQIASSSSTIQTSTRIRSTSDDSFFDDDDSRSRTHDDDDDDDDEYDNNKKNRELRFAGVGRLYTSTKDYDSYDENNNKKNKNIIDNVPEHVQIIERLSNATVLVVGLGGVGSWAAEALCRSGIGNLIFIDLDDICISNTNRQLHAMSSTVGKMKIDEMKRRLVDINPQCNVTLLYDFVGPNNIDTILTTALRQRSITACLDAIDGAKGKTSLIAACARYSIPVVTCGSSAGRTDPTRFVCDDLTRVIEDKLLRNCRRELRKYYGFEGGRSFYQQLQKPVRKWRIMAVFSLEPQKTLPKGGGGGGGSSLRRCDGALGTACFVTGAAGFIAAGQIVGMIANNKLLVPRNPRGNVPLQETVGDEGSSYESPIMTM